VTAWHLGPMLAYDTESTDKFPETARLVTACVSRVDGGGKSKPVTRTWLAAPDVEISAEAAGIHGITTEELLRAAAEGIPVVGCNIPFDFTLTDRETRRNSLDPFGPAFEAAGGFCIDGLVLDKALDPYRKGKRPLGLVAEHYGVRAGKAHDAAGDATTAVRVAWAIARKYPRIANMPLGELHAFQVDAKRKQAASLAEHFARTGKPEPVDGSWPWKPWTETAGAA
jgi:DNA polymerase-3 subunit epsilon